MSNGFYKVYSSLLHCAVEVLVIFLIVRYPLVDVHSLSMHYLVILSLSPNLDKIFMYLLDYLSTRWEEFARDNRF